MSTKSSMFHGDFATIAREIEPGSIDLIYTDPPYNRRDAEVCFDLLAQWSMTLLKDQGSLVTIVPHYYLEQVVLKLANSGLKYRWIYEMDQTEGAHPRMAMGVEVCHKPMLHYVKRSYPQGKGFLRDKVIIPGPEKDLHEWQQAEAWADYYLPRLCPPGGTVLDPFCGPGTVPAVAIRYGLNWIGVERDMPTLRAALERIELASLQRGD